MKKNKKRFNKAQKLYLILHGIVLLILIHNVMLKNYENVFICVLTLVLFLMPSILERRLKVKIPEFLEIIILLFIFCAEILGEINSFYTRIPNWDTMLHVVNGFVASAIGLSMIELLNNNKQVKMMLSPLFVAIVSFCFSMTIGVCWEFFEFGMDKLFDLDMQKDTVVNEINSVLLDEDDLNVVHNIKINSLVVNHQDWKEKYGGYIDIGLIDTMKDLFVNFIGALTFAIIGYFMSKHSSNHKMKRLLIVADDCKEIEK